MKNYTGQGAVCMNNLRQECFRTTTLKTQQNMDFNLVRGKQYVCKCFYTDNYFSKIANKHYQFNDKAKFKENNAKVSEFIV